MSATNGGRQSPPPEEQSDSQINAPSNGQGISQGGDNQEASKNQLDGLSSNPTGILDEHAKDTVSKTFKAVEAST